MASELHFMFSIQEMFSSFKFCVSATAVLLFLSQGVRERKPGGF